MNVTKFIYDKDRPLLIYLGWTAATAMLCSLGLLWCFSLIVPTIAEGTGPATRAVTIGGALAAIVLIPLVENLFLIGAIGALALEIEKKSTIILVVALLSGVLHALAHHWMFISGAILFATMSKTYLDFPHLSIWKRYWAIVAQHALFNTPATVYQLFNS
jgi:hypothetical protein